MDDFRVLFETVRDNHPYLALKARTEGYYWVAQEQEFASWVEACRSNEDFAKAVGRILASVNNGHTGVIGGAHVRFLQEMAPSPWQHALYTTTPELADRWLALSKPDPYVADPACQAAYLHGDYVIVEARGAQRQVVGMRLVETMGMPVHEYVSSLRGVIRLRYDPLAETVYAPLLMIPPGTAVLEDESGRRVEMTLHSVGERMTYAFVPGPIYSGHTANLFQTTLAGGQAGYIHIARMSTIEADIRSIREAVECIKDCPVLIIDIRGNGGGSDSFWNQLLQCLIAEPIPYRYRVVCRSGEFVRPFLAAMSPVFPRLLSKEEVIATLPPEAQAKVPPEVTGDAFSEGAVLDAVMQVPEGSLRYAGTVYVLTDDRVFSSAEGFAMFCKTTGWATLVGSPTGGDTGIAPAGIGLPNSGLAFLMPVVMALNADGIANEEGHTVPDIVVEMTAEELLALSIPQPGPNPSTDAVLRECLRAAGLMGP